MAVTSDASPFTSVTVSPQESHDATQLPMELKIPLPSSSTCSDEDEELGQKGENTVPDSISRGNHDQHGSFMEDQGKISQVLRSTTKEAPNAEEAKIEPAMNLGELAYLAQEEKYYRCEAHSKQARLKDLDISCGMQKRLIDTVAIAYGNMIDQFKTDDQAGFAGIYEACEQLKEYCDPANTLSLSGLPSAKGISTKHSGQESQPVFDMLQPNDQELILAFLIRIRTDPDYLSERISALTSAELTALTSTYHPAGIDFSILQNHSHGKSQFFSRDSQMMKLSRRMDNLHFFHNQDPFFALLFGIFDRSASPGSAEYLRREDVWSTACARVMIEGFTRSKPGTDEFAIATMDAFCKHQEWPLKPKFEMYLMSLLVEGSFLLDVTSNLTVDYKDSVETHNAKAAIAEADFFDNALTGLIGLLATGGYRQAVPLETLSFAHAILRRIDDPRLRLRAQQFIVIRWYFATFISSIMVYPEVCGTLMTQHIGESARRLILQKIVVRLQEQVFDVILPWNPHALIKSEIRDGIMKIFHLFNPPIRKLARSTVPNCRDEEGSTRFIVLTPLDVTGLIELLCPDKSPSPGQVHLIPAGFASDRPSTAGSSTLVAGSSDFDSTIPLPPSQADLDDKDPKNFLGVGSNPMDTANDPAGMMDLKGEAEALAAKAMKPSNEDANSQLRHVCHKLKDLVARSSDSTGRSMPPDWSHLHYSSDGLSLSVTPVRKDTSIEDLQTPLSGRERDQDQVIVKESESTEELKASIIQLLIRQDQLDVDRNNESQPEDPLEMVINDAADKAHMEMDFFRAHSWWTTLQSYQDYKAQSPNRSCQTLFRSLSEKLRTSISFLSNVSEHCEANLRALQGLQDSQSVMLAKMDDSRTSLRVKMWYISDVRNSASYEEALFVTRALRSMANTKKQKQGGSISSWARQRLRGSSIHDRAEAQTLEAMVAPKDQGGLSKLADEQVEITGRWLTRRSIENFCKGEERIHRFCYEIQKSVGKIAGSSLLESPVLWSSNLFRRERSSYDLQRTRPGSTAALLNTPTTSSGHPLHGTLPFPSLGPPIGLPRTSAAAKARSPAGTIAGYWIANQAFNKATGLGIHATQPPLPPTPTSPPYDWSGSSFSPVLPSYQTPHSSLGSRSSASHSRAHSEEESSPRTKAFAENIKKSLYSLLISDLGYLLWNHGSETDAWISTSLDLHRPTVSPQSPHLVNRSPTTLNTDVPINDINHQHSDSNYGPAAECQPSAANLPNRDVFERTRAGTAFPWFSEAYATLLGRISVGQDPYAKLASLYELEVMICKYLSIRRLSPSQDSASDRGLAKDGHRSFRSKSVPRTKATSMQEVIANCTERRAGTMRVKASQATPTPEVPASASAVSVLPDTDDIVDVFLTLFRDSKIRPNTLFRDLQYIASCVPSEILDQTIQGKAFWDAGLAALALKEELCESMIQRASQITAYHVLPRSSDNTTIDDSLASTTLGDAAKLWLITAKEGSPVASRELALFYLTQPELLPRVTMPFSKAKDVYKSAVSSDVRPLDRERGRLDPYTFAAVFHWMEVAANGGDKDAKDFLKGNGELSGGR